MKFESRFIKKSDYKMNKFVFNLPEYWPSRAYEYAWASEFIDKGDVSLDAACGLCHPLKFYLLDSENKTYACDVDRRLMSESAIRQEISEVFGHDAEKAFEKKYFENINYELADLTKLPYKNEFFDKVYCISVLEHLNDKLNKYNFIRYIPILNKLVSNDIYKSLQEFKRVLKKDGFIILTFDYPRINLNYLKDCIKKLGLIFHSNYNFNLENDSLYSEKHQLYFFRAILRHKE